MTLVSVLTVTINTILSVLENSFDQNPDHKILNNDKSLKFHMDNHKKDAVWGSIAVI